VLVGNGGGPGLVIKKSGKISAGKSSPRGHAEDFLQRACRGWSERTLAGA